MSATLRLLPRTEADRKREEEIATRRKVEASGWAFRDEPVLSLLGRVLLYDDLAPHQRATIRERVAAVVADAKAGRL